jgi:hypothetical protein
VKVKLFVKISKELNDRFRQYLANIGVFTQGVLSKEVAAAMEEYLKKRTDKNGRPIERGND